MPKPVKKSKPTTKSKTRPATWNHGDLKFDSKGCLVITNEALIKELLKRLRDKEKVCVKFDKSRLKSVVSMEPQMAHVPGTTNTMCECRILDVERLSVTDRLGPR